MSSGASRFAKTCPAPGTQRLRLKAGGHFGALHCQITVMFIKCTALQIGTYCPLDFSLCYQLGVLVCQWFKSIFMCYLIRLLFYYFLKFKNIATFKFNDVVSSGKFRCLYCCFLNKTTFVNNCTG